jgi:pimeloyl-ACP methyl ester carboxylesterase
MDQGRKSRLSLSLLSRFYLPIFFIKREKMAEYSLGLTRRRFVGGSGALGLVPVVSTTGAVAKAAVDEAAPIAPPVKPAPQPDMIDRAFVRLKEGLVHYRYAGSRQSSKLPLYLAHAGPGSSLGMAELIREFAPTRFAIAPDMLGNGDSAPPASENTNMPYYAECAVRLLDSQKIEKVDFLGSHTGAQIGIEVAARWPDRVRRLVLDGLPLFPEDFKKDLLANYAPKVEPDEYGGHLMWAWNFVRDQFLYWPHYNHDAAHRLANGILPPRAMHGGVVDVLKCLDTYRIAYQAAFAQDVRSILPQVKAPVLFMATERDPLHFYLDDVAALMPGAKKMLFVRGSPPEDRFKAIREFLDG